MLSLLFSDKVKASIGVMELDCSVEERHESTAEATEHAIGDGSDVSDHIIVKGDTVEIHGKITNTPIMYLASIRAESPVKGGQPSFLPAEDRVSEGFAYLRRIQKEKMIVDAVFTLHSYSNMHVHRLSTTRTAKSANSLDVIIVLKEILKAKAYTVDLPYPIIEATKGATDKGKKAKIESTPKQKVKGKSTVKRIKDAFGSLVGL